MSAASLLDSYYAARMATETSTSDEVPAFIGDDWLFNDGWSFRERPSADLADPAQLDSPRKWDRFLCVLAQAKRGDFSHVEVLSRLLAEKQPHPLFLAAMYLGAAIGRPAEVTLVAKWLGTEWFTQAAAAIVLTGDLALVDALLDRRRGAGAEVRETMEGAVSQLLEAAPERFYETGLDDEAYDTAVRAEVAALTARHEAGFRFALGAPLRPRTFVGKLTQLGKLEHESLDEASAMLGSLALHLETLTGLPSCGVVTTDTSGNEVVDRHRLGRFLEAAEAWDEKHRPRSGRRMFFGHVVPDGR